MERQLLESNDNLTLTAKDGSESEFTILEYIGSGSDCVCYFAKSEEISGRLKEFSPLEKLTQKKYLERREEFLTHLKILEKARNSQEGQVLNNCLPVQDILYCKERLFVWSPQDRYGITLAEYLQKTPQEKRSFSYLLKIIMTVGSFLKTIHIMGLVHCDIKPQNVLITTDADKKEINPYNLTVFDSGSVINLLLSTSPTSCGTKGYAAPELAYKKVGNYCDIFSLGAVLFNAITDKKFCKEDYALLPQYVALSVLTRDLNIKSQRLLTKILQEALAPLIQNRYARVSDMLEDIRRLEKNMTALPQKKDDLSMKILLQNLLYRNPLESKKRDIFVAVIGAGSLGQKFIDQILQIQVPYLNANGTFSERNLWIKTFSLEADLDRETYLNVRPALKDFVKIQGEEPTEDCYARLDFCATPTVQGRAFSSNMDINRKLAKKIIETFEGELDYVFVALGDDELNRAVAAAFDFLSCPVTFISQNIPAVRDFQLERMGFNTHLSWLGSLSGVEINDVREEYLQRYNHESSLDYALSVRYKLAALEISLEDNLMAAQQFAEKIKNQDLLATLSMYEHRRWLLEKVTLGWRAQKDIEFSCLNSLRRNGKPQSDSEFLHHCLVPCGKEQPLSEMPEKWNEPPDDTLDPLDKMSVILHQALVRESTRLKRANFDSYMKPLRDDLNSFDVQLDKFEWLLKEIWSNNIYHSRKFKSYFKEFKKSLSTKAVKATTESLDLIFRTFIVIAESNLCRNYKANDKILVENIPLILTYEQPQLAMAFDDRETFLNVASSTILNPKKLKYLYCFDKKSRTKDLIQRVQALQKYFSERKIKAELSFVIAVLPMGKFEEKKFQMTFPEMKLEVQKCQNSNAVTEFFLEKLREGNYLFDGSTKLFRLLSDQSEFTQKISVNLPYFELDMLTKKFVSVAKVCEFLKYIKDEAHLQVKDIFSLQAIEAQARAQTDAFHYEKLFEIFKRNLQALLLLEKSVCENKTFYFNLQAKESPVILKYFLPETIKVESLVTELKNQDIILDFKIAVHDGSIALEIITGFELENLIDEVLSCFERNMTVEEVKKEGGGLKIFCRGLSASVEYNDEITKIFLKELATNHFIRNLKFEEKRARFLYASEAVRKILTDPQKALETFLYLEIFRTGTFEEIACDVNFQWLSRERKRFSMVLTKGFGSVIVQVSREATSAALYEFTAVTDKVADKVGLNSKKVFVIICKPSTTFKELAEKLDILLIHDHLDLPIF